MIKMKVILASQSPRRKELLSKVISDFEIIPSNFDESKINEKEPSKIVEILSKSKGMEVYDRLNKQDNFIIISSDTIVVLDDKILGKPKDKEDSFRMLKELQNNKHTVYTGLFVLKNENGKLKEVLTHSKTDVYFKKLSDEEIIKYINSENTLDKAGAYAIQGNAKAFVEKTKGNIETVIGLDIEKLKEILNII